MHPTLPDRHAIEQLVAPNDRPVVSLYLPTHQAGPETRENPIRYKNRLTEAEAQLESAGWRRDDLGALLAPARELDDYRFWQHQRQGLAVFLVGGERLVYRLPYAPPELTVVAPRAHLKPLLPLLTGDGRFFILAMSLNQARLFEATRHSVSEVVLEDRLISLAEALKYDDFEPHAEHYTVSAPNRGDAALFQGQGAGEDERKTNILRYFQAFDNGLRELLEPQGDRIPVVFAGDKGIFPIYRETNHYKGLLDDFVEGNPDDIAPEALHERAWEVVEPHFRRALGADQDALMQAVGTARPARRSRRCCWRRSTPASTPSLSRWANASGASSTPTPARWCAATKAPRPMTFTTRRRPIRCSMAVRSSP